MNAAMLEMMKIQGQLRIKYIGLGVDGELALTLSEEAIHLFLTSKLADRRFADEYAALNQASQSDDKSGRTC